MQTTNTPLPKSRLQLEFELPPERLDRAIGKAVGRLSRRTRVPGFRPGKAPRPVLERVVGRTAILDDALEQLVEDSYREALLEQDFAPLTAPEIEVTQGEEGKPVLFKATVQVRPEIALGDFENFKFKPEVENVDETMVEKVLDELRDSEARLEPVEGRPAENGDYAIVAFEGTRDGAAFIGGSSEQMPLILGQNRLYPGFEDHVVGLRKGEDCEFDLDIPEDFQVATMRGRHMHFHVTLKELRGKVLPEANDEFARSIGRFTDLDHLKAELRKRLEASALDRARHQFADRIVDYAAANATIDLPDILVDQEVEIMRDEMRSAMAGQGISEEAYLKATGKTDAEMREQLRPQAEKRARSLLALSEIARIKGVEIADADVEAEVVQARSRYASDRSLVQYFESERGRNYIRNTLRRSRTVEQLVDEWLAAHPEAPRLRHVEDAEQAAAEAPQAEASASVGAIRPGSVTPPAVSAPGA
ncbi:MAG: trigger factor [Candidatus Limnocylindrales bacterium]|jgi:trigger factor